MLGAGQPTAGLNHFPLSQTGEPSGFRSPLISQSIIGTTRKSRGALLAHSDLVSFPYNPPPHSAQADNHPSCSTASSFTLEGLRGERCCLHRLAWQGSAMHLKAGGEEEEEEERGLREGGGGEKRESGGGG